MEEFGIPGRIIEPVRAEITVSPQEQGVLFRGSIKGVVALPCDRCADDSVVILDHAFSSFEPYPSSVFADTVKHAAGKSASRKKEQEDRLLDNDADENEPVDEDVIRIVAHGKGIEINPAALAWEEFSLALPVKPLCGESCKGLCPECGANRNTDSCACSAPKGDPRLAALRGLTVPKK